MFVSRYIACPECGALVERDGSDGHECEQEQWIEFQVSHVRPELDRLESELHAFLTTPQGSFELWYAERQRLRAA
jgi:hypothetical protein